MSNLLIDLNQLTVVQADDPTGRDEPYLWVFGIVIDQSNDDPEGLRFILKKNPRPGNLGSSVVRKGESRQIPDSLGRFERTIKPVFGRFGAGIAVVAWEHDKTPDQTMKVAYDECATALDAFVQELIIKRFTEQDFGPLTDDERKQIETQVRTIIEQRLRQTLGVGTLNIDDAVGSASFFQKLDAAAPFSKALTFDLESRKPEDSKIGAGKVISHYRIIGQFKYTP
jgi:hypothetical protein